MKPSYILLLIVLIGFVSFNEQNYNSNNYSKLQKNKLKKTAITFDTVFRNKLIGAIDSDEDNILPKTYKEEEGLVIEFESPFSLNSLCYSISKYRKNHDYVAIFEKELRKGNPHSISKVIDALCLKNVPENELIQFQQCYRITGKDTVSDNKVFALVKDFRKHPIYLPVIKAWYADTKKGEIIQLSNLKNIICMSDYEDGD